MKIYLIVPFFVIGSLFPSFAQQWQIGLYTPFRIPEKTTMPNMRNVYGWGLQAAYSPWATTPVFFEVKADWNQYAYRTYSDAYYYNDGFVSDEYITFRSKLNHYLVGSKIMIGQSFGTVRGFITPQIGFASMKSKVEIETNKQTFNNNNTLYRKVFERNLGGVYGLELGMEVALEKLFSSVSEKDVHRLYLSVSYMGSFQKMKYLNVRKMEETLINFPNYDGQIYTDQFVQMTPNNIYQKQFAEIYRSNLQLFGITLGYIASF